MHRKRRGFCRYAAALFLTLLFISIPGPVAAIGQNAYHVDVYDVEIDLKSDGSAMITERILFVFEDDLNSIDLFINQNRSARLSEVSVAVSDRNPPIDIMELREKQDQQDLLQELTSAAVNGGSAVPMTYQQTDQEDAVRLRMHAFFEGGTSRLVEIRYGLSEVVRRSADTAFVKQRLVALRANTFITHLNFSLTLPYQPDDSNSWFQSISKNRPAMQQVKVDRWIVAWDQLNMEDSPDLILLMPQDVFPDVSQNLSLPLRQELIEQTEAELARLEQNRFWLGSLHALMFFLLGLSLIFMLLVYLLFDREGAPSVRNKYQMPKHLDYPPAVLSILMRTSKPGILIFSTLIDLVRREELEIEGLVFTWKNPDRNDYTGFKAFEIFLLQWLFDRISKGRTLSTVQIRDYARDRATSEEFNGYYEQFRQLLNEELPMYGFFDETKGRYGRLIGLSLSAAYLVIGILGMVLLRSWTGLLLLAPASAFFFYGLSLRHLTGFGNEQYTKGKAIRRYLASFYDLEVEQKSPFDLPDCRELADALPYAIALDRTKNFMRQLILLAKDRAICSAELIDTYQFLSTRNETVRPEKENEETEATTRSTDLSELDRSEKQDHSVDSGKPVVSEAARAASAEQIRLLGRDLVAMESMLLASFYLSSHFHLIEDHNQDL